MTEKVRVVIRRVLGAIGLIIFFAVAVMAVFSSGEKTDCVPFPWAERIAFYAFCIFGVTGILVCLFMVLDVGPQKSMNIVNLVAFFALISLTFLALKALPLIERGHMTLLENLITKAFLFGWPIINVADLFIAWRWPRWW